MSTRDNEMIPQRPEFLKKIIELKRSREDCDKELFTRFLQQAQIARNDADSSGMISIRMASKIRTTVSKDGLPKNGSLRLIFDFYAKFQSPPAAASISFEDRKIHDETMSFFEVVIFCRNFQIIPKLISKHELKFLWKIINIERIQNGIPVQQYIDFEEFKLFLVRIAILAYHKPGMTMLIHAICGFVPDNKVMVESLAQYLHLPDQNHVREVIDTVGRLSISRYNLRSTGDKSNQVSHELRQDVRARRLAQILAVDVDSKLETKVLSPADSSKLIKGVSLPELTEASAPMASPKTPKGSLSSPRLSFSQNLLLSPDITSTPIEPPRSPSSQTSTIILTDHMIHNQSMKIATLMRQRAKTTKAGDVTNLGIVDVLTEIIREADFTEDKNNNLSKDKKFSSERTHVPVKTIVFTLRKIADVPGAIISDPQEQALLTFDRDLANYFDKYSKVHHGNGVTPSDSLNGFLDSEGPFVDLGRVDGGTFVTIRVLVTNKSSQDIEMDIITKDFNSQDISITTLPKAFAAGLQMHAIITFTVPRETQTVIGSIDVLAVPTRRLPAVRISCPVHFRVRQLGIGAAMTSSSVPHSPTTQIQTSDSGENKYECTARTLPGLLGRYTGSSPKLTVNFEKNNVFWDGTDAATTTVTSNNNTNNNHNTTGGMNIAPLLIQVGTPTRTLWTRQVEDPVNQRTSSLEKSKKLFISTSPLQSPYQRSSGRKFS
eukprot:gene1293-2498_t